MAEYVAWSFVSEDKREILLNLVMTNVHGNPLIIDVKLKGLDPDLKYKLEYSCSSCNDTPEEALFSRDDGEQVYTGAALMNGGYAFDPLYGVFPSMQIYFKAIV